MTKNNLNDLQTGVCIDALNHYWHYITQKLSQKDLGKIQRKNLVLDEYRTYKTLLHLGQTYSMDRFLKMK